MSRKMVALSMAAIGTIYTAGYVQTQDAADTLAQLVNSSSKSQRVRPGEGSVATASRYRIVDAGFNDGTYVGEGRGRLGSMEVTIQIDGGRVTSARITWATMAYPVARIGALPAQVVERQSADVDLVSGATASAHAFIDGARIALNLARRFEVVRMSDTGPAASGS
jgi:uncharacterized protein with FMN-binding domain